MTDARGSARAPLTADQERDLAYARVLVEAGIPVFVLYPDPAHAGEFIYPTRWQQTQPRSSYVDAWRPGMALGVVMGQGIDLVDVDPRNGGDIAAISGAMPTVYAEATTPSGGVHYFVASMNVRSRDGVLPGIDVKAGDEHGEGRGFAFIAPTVRPSKVTGEFTPYRWVMPPNPETLAITGDDTSGQALASLVTSSRSVTSSSPAVGGAGIASGERNSTLASLAGTMRRRGMTEAAILAGLLEMNATECAPPLDESEVQRIAASISRYEPEGIGDMSAPLQAGGIPDLNSYALTDVGNAETFAALHGSRVKFDQRRQRWLAFNDGHWDDVTATIRMFAKSVARERHAAALGIDDLERRKAATKWALLSESRQRQDAMIEMAKSEPSVADDGETWDADPMLLGVRNGVVDLATGQLRPGRLDDRVTLVSPFEYDPRARAERWERFIDEVFQNDAALIGYVQRMLGYGITGSVSEQVFHVLFGAGANGKSALLNAVRSAAGPYGHNLPFTALEKDGRAAIPADIAQLPHKRLVTASETNDGTRFNEARIKVLSGGDPITAAEKFKPPFTFTSVAKLLLAVNSLPVVRDDSDGFWRRVRVIPFSRQFGPADADLNLGAQLTAELPGILAWMVRGAVEWSRSGLRPPEQVMLATWDYRAESDPLGDFFLERCVLSDDAEIGAYELYAHYAEWADQANLRRQDVMSNAMFGRHVAARFSSKRGASGKTYRGIGLKPAISMVPV